jgi:hypothetical protein
MFVSNVGVEMKVPLYAYNAPRNYISDIGAPYDSGGSVLLGLRAVRDTSSR